MKISIVIPTRERAQYLKYSLQTALEIDDPNLEIVVSNNASTDDTAAIVAAFDDPRLIYVETTKRVSMRENFNRAFLASSGEYLIFFGDDDGILPRQFKYLRDLLEKHRPDGISWGRRTFGWPIPGYGKKTGGVRLHRNNSFGQMYAYEAADSRDDLLACKLTNMSPIPEIYHGCMSRDYLIRTSLDPEIVFDTTIPDYCIAYRAVLKGGSFLHVDHGFSINGYSPASTGGGQSSSQNSSGNDSTSKQFAQENETDPLTDVVGYTASVPLAFFSTLETVKARYGLTEFLPDYFAWYRYVLGSARNNATLKAELAEVLMAYALKTESEDELNKALDLPLQSKRTMRDRWNKLSAIGNSFRVSTTINGQNTILTAAHTVDEILGDGYEHVLAGSQTARAAWKEAKARSRNFVREL